MLEWHSRQMSYPLEIKLLLLSQSLKPDGRRSTTDAVATIPFLLSLSSAALSLKTSFLSIR